MLLVQQDNFLTIRECRHPPTPPPHRACGPVCFYSPGSRERSYNTAVDLPIGQRKMGFSNTLAGWLGAYIAHIRAG